MTEAGNTAAENAGEDPEELIDRYLDAYRSGTAPTAEAYAAAHPSCAQELLELLPLMLRMESVTPPGEHPPEAAAAQALPEVIDGEYRPDRLIGTGGMGTVYAATQLSLNRPCALKILRGATAGSDALRRFTAESRLIARLHHPNIVGVLSAGMSDGFGYYAMDLVEGPPPQTFCTSPEAVARIGLQLARALAYAHSCGFIHCDVKPDNILAEADGTVRLSDFGLSCAVGDTAGDTGGTLRYMAPERLRREPFTGAADQYALGVTLREFLGDTFLRDLPTADIRRTVLADRLPPLTGCPADLAAIIGKMTAFSPEDRYVSMHRAAEDFAAYLEHRPVLARGATPIRRLCLWARRRPVSAASSALALFCALGAVAALAVGYRKTAEARLDAENSALVAHRTLARVLDHVGQAPPTHADVRLLNDLIPYYTRLAQSRKDLSRVPEAFLRSVYATFGSAALRSGQPELAADAFRRLRQLETSASADNRYALALDLAGRTDEARETDRRTVQTYTEADTPQQRLDALDALVRLAKTDRSYVGRITPLLESLCRDIPEDPELRYQTARLLILFPETVSRACRPDPSMSDTEYATELLLPLTAIGTSPRYEGALIKYATAYLERLRPGQTANPRLITLALSGTGLLLGHWLGERNVTNEVTAFWMAYARYLRDTGDFARYEAFCDRLYGVLDVLSYSSETSDRMREFLLELILERLQWACESGSEADITFRRMQFRHKLKSYRGPRAETFRRSAEALLSSRLNGKKAFGLLPLLDFTYGCSFFAPIPVWRTGTGPDGKPRPLPPFAVPMQEPSAPPTAKEALRADEQ